MLNTTRPIQVSSENEAIEMAELASVIYHDIFEFPLNIQEIIKWKTGKKVEIELSRSVLVFRNGYYFLYGRDASVFKRIMRKRISKKKNIIAKKAANILSFIPTVKMVAVTGALAMENANDNSDIDLMIVTQKNTLWATRGITLVLFKLLGIPVRKYQNKEQKNKLCLNMWLDEDNLTWEKKNRNIFTAHEIAQVKPLINKKNVYEKFLSENIWVSDFWPNATNNCKKKYKDKKFREVAENLLSLPFEIFGSLAFKLQYLYMKNKITREVVEEKRALFHPVDWSEHIKIRLQDKLSFY
jgi:predicted nucleotidyltransferase